MWQTKERYCIPLGPVGHRGAQCFPDVDGSTDGARRSATLTAARQGDGWPRGSRSTPVTSHRRMYMTSASHYTDVRVRTWRQRHITQTYVCDVSVTSHIRTYKTSASHHTYVHDVSVTSHRRTYMTSASHHTDVRVRTWRQRHITQTYVHDVSVTSHRRTYMTSASHHTDVRTWRQRSDTQCSFTDGLDTTIAACFFGYRQFVFMFQRLMYICACKD